MLEVLRIRDELLEPRIERFRHDQALRPAVAEHVGVVAFGQERVDRHGDDAGLEAAEKRGEDRIQGREVCGVFRRQR